MDYGIAPPSCSTEAPAASSLVVQRLNLHRLLSTWQLQLVPPLASLPPDGPLSDVQPARNTNSRYACSTTQSTHMSAAVTRVAKSLVCGCVTVLTQDFCPGDTRSRLLHTTSLPTALRELHLCGGIAWDCSRSERTQVVLVIRMKIDAIKHNVRAALATAGRILNQSGTHQSNDKAPSPSIDA